MKASINSWPKPGTIAGIIILVVMIVLGLIDVTPFNVYWWAWLNLPMYMLHQFEEYVYPGKFRETMNSILTGGKSEDAPLTETHVIIINVGFIWVGMTLLNLLAPFSLAFPLVMITVTTVNGFTHIFAALARRKYNPGLVFSIAFNLPYGFAMIAWIALLVSPLTLWFGIILGIVLHLMVFVLMGILRKRVASIASEKS